MDYHSIEGYQPRNTMAGIISDAEAALAMADTLDEFSRGEDHVIDENGVVGASWDSWLGGWVVHDRGWAMSGQMPEEILRRAEIKLAGGPQNVVRRHRKRILAAARQSCLAQQRTS